MSKITEGIYVRIVSVEGLRITVSSTHPGDFGEIGEPPIKIDGVEIEGRGIGEEGGGYIQSDKAHRLVFTAKHGQALKRLQPNKRYKLSSY
jgi:hypothetical protein